MTYTMALFALLVVTVSWLLISSSTAFARSAYRSGQRSALKNAIALAETRQLTATTLAPRGKLAVGLLRAGEAHAIEMDLREELRRLDQ